jgi:hypothetical protein
MKLIIAGSRTVTNYIAVEAAIMERAKIDPKAIDEVVSGCAQGADALGIKWAEQWSIPIKRFPVTNWHWETYGKQAGVLRNIEMAKYVRDNGGGALVAIWDGASRGTKQMIECARSHGLTVHVHETY